MRKHLAEHLVLLGDIGPRSHAATANACRRPSSPSTKYERQWRFYKTASGNSPVRRFLDELPLEEVAEIVAAMNHVRVEGLTAARHLRGEIYEVRVDAPARLFRILFAKEGRFGQVLLALEGFQKDSRKTPSREIDLAEKRLSDWRARGQQRKRVPQRKA